MLLVSCKPDIISFKQFMRESKKLLAKPLGFPEMPWIIGVPGMAPGMAQSVMHLTLGQHGQASRQLPHLRIHLCKIHCEIDHTNPYHDVCLTTTEAIELIKHTKQISVSDANLSAGTRPVPARNAGRFQRFCGHWSLGLGFCIGMHPCLTP